MSDRVALDGCSMCDERKCDQNTHEPFLNRTQPIWRLDRLYLNRDARTNVPVSVSASRSRITTKLPSKLYISNTTTLLHGQKQSWEIIQTRCDQLT